MGKNPNGRKSGGSSKKAPVARVVASPVAVKHPSSTFWKVVAFLITTAVPLGGVYLAYRSTVPRIDGSIVLSSIGKVPRANDVGSVALLVSLRGSPDASFVPINYRLRIRLKGAWREAVVQKQFSVGDKAAMYFPGDAPQPIFAGDWTACFSRTEYLMNPVRLAEPITGKERLGVLFFRMDGISAAEITSRGEMQLIIETSSGEEYRIREAERGRANYELMREYLLARAELLPGFSECK